MNSDAGGKSASNDGLGLVPAAHVRWHEQNGWDVTEFSGLLEHPEVEAFWGNRTKLALYTADQVRAAVAAERERWQQIVKRVARDANRYGLEGVHCECEVSDSGALTSWKMHA